MSPAEKIDKKPPATIAELEEALAKQNKIVKQRKQARKSLLGEAKELQAEQTLLQQTIEALEARQELILKLRILRQQLMAKQIEKQITLNRMEASVIATSSEYRDDYQTTFPQPIIEDDESLTSILSHHPILPKNFSSCSLHLDEESD
jgi:hypothetical protein